MNPSAPTRSASTADGTPSGLWSLSLLILAVLLALATVGSGGAGLLRMAVLLVFAPLTEEAVFRAGLQEVLLRHRIAPLAANGLTALTFGLLHAMLRADVAAMSVGLPALLIGAVYQRRRRLRDCIALHAAMNSLWLVWALGNG